MAKDNPKYNVYLGLNFDGFTKGAQEANRIGKKLDRMFKGMERAQNNVEIGQKKLDRALKAGRITTEQHAKATALLKFEQQKYEEKVRKAEAATNKEAQAHLAAEKAAERHRRTIHKLNKEKEQQRIAKGLGLITLAGSATSAMGMGGAAAGMARTGAGAGLMMGMGATGMMGMAAGGLVVGLGAGELKKSVVQFMELERQVKSMQTLLGRGLGTKTVEQMRELARTTPLTTAGLIESAKIWASYGQSVDGITERMRRFGEISGGNAEQMKLLTRAMAQVNATGKLMGQEKNQLINAGMNLEAVAKAAGIEMKDFGKAMEAGAISAEHVNQAVINLTNEGGMFHGYMADQAETLGGRLDVLKNSYNDMLATMGGAASNTGFFNFLLVPAEKALNVLTAIAGEVERISDKNDKIIGEDGKEIKYTGQSRLHNMKGMSETRRNWFSDKDVYQNEAYTDQIRMMKENNDRYATAGSRRKYEKEEKLAEEARKKQEAAERHAKKVKEAEEKRKRDTERQRAGVETSGKFISDQQSRRLSQQNIAKYVQKGYSVANARKIDAEQSRHKAASRQIFEGYEDSTGNIDPKYKAKYDADQAAADKAHKAEMLAIKARQTNENKIKKLNEDAKKAQETHKETLAKGKDFFDGKRDSMKAGFDRGKAMQDRYLELQGRERGFKGGSVDEFKFISQMKQDSLKDQVEEARLKKEEAMLQKLEDARQKWQEAENTKLETKMQQIADNVANVEQAIKIREF